MEEKRNMRKIKTGIVTSAHKIRKTIRVEVERLVKHPLYKKYFKRTSSFLVHDEKEECNFGDRVKIMETRPLSCRKHWLYVGIVAKAKDALSNVAEVDEADEGLKSTKLKSNTGKDASKAEEALS